MKHNFLNHRRPTPPLGSTSAHQSGKALHWLLLSLVLTGLTLKYNEVDDRVSADDLLVLRQMLRSDKSLPREALPNESWPEQRALIARTFQQVMAAAPSRKDIPEGRPREPADVLRNGGGVCYDLSRLIEKALQAQGFHVRHVALYRKQPGKNLMQTLITRRVISHAVSEVLTKRGWLLIDSLGGWIALDAHANPLSAQLLAANADSNLSHLQTADTPEFYRQPFLYVYGLYSRHGNFYPPFNPIPDLNYPQLLDNFR